MVAVDLRLNSLCFIWSCWLATKLHAVPLEKRKPSIADIAYNRAEVTSHWWLNMFCHLPELLYVAKGCKT